MSNTWEGVHFWIKANSTPSFSMLEFCPPGGLKLQVVPSYFETVRFHESGERIMCISMWNYIQLKDIQRRRALTFLQSQARDDLGNVSHENSWISLTYTNHGFSSWDHAVLGLAYRLLFQLFPIRRVCKLHLSCNAAAYPRNARCLGLCNYESAKVSVRAWVVVHLKR